MDPLNCQFIQEMKDGWDQYLDKKENKHFYFNMILGKRQWEDPFKKDFDPIFGPCLKCRGWGLNLVNEVGYCQRCSKNTKQIQNKVQVNIELEDPIYNHMGPCEKCRGYGKNLVSQYQFCKRCFQAAPKQKLEQKMISTLQIQQTKQSEINQASKARDLKTNNQQALDKLLTDLSSHNQKTLDDLAKQQDIPEFPENFQADVNKKRPAAYSAGRVYSELGKADPMDPTGGAGKKSNVLGSMSKAADETAEGSLFQQRPYANPRKVLQTMQQKKNMF